MSKTRNNLAEGDTVMLLSSGPIMTINTVNHADLVTCFWFSGDEIKWAEFNPVSLKKVDPKEYK